MCLKCRRRGEEQFVYDQLVANPDKPIMSFVADSYDVFKFTDFCTAPNSRIRKLIESRPHQKLILRPDSGNPIEVITDMLAIMDLNKIETVEHEKILFKDFSILWGDGITINTMEDILKYFTIPRKNTNIYAAENFIFGSGGDLMQNLTRDTQKFAIKCSSITNQKGQQIDVFKDPITDPGKTSLKGKVETFIKENGKLVTINTVNGIPEEYNIILQTIFKNGKTYNEPSLKEIRKRVEKNLQAMKS